MTRSPVESRRRWMTRVLAVSSLLIVTLFLFYPPVGFDGKMVFVGRGVCHQLPGHSFIVGGHQLPLCARCTGIYLGAMMGLAGFFLLGRWRSVQWSPLPVLAVLLGFIAVMIADGVNSFLWDIPGAPHLYEPQNWLRLTTGAFHGLAMIALLMPLVNESWWHPAAGNSTPVIRNFKELGGFMLGGAGVVALVLWHPAALYLPLAFFSTFGVLVMLALINSVFALIILGREASARTGRAVLLPLVMGLAGAIVLLGGMNALRTYVAAVTGVPL